jgi:DnaJ-domain-containing protein 1
MDSFSDRLGKLLSDVLESGEIPQKKSSGHSENNGNFSVSSTDKPVEKPAEKHHIWKPAAGTAHKPTGEVLHAGSYQVSGPSVIPPEVSAAYAVIGLTPGTPFKEVHNTLRKLLKKTHPDMNNNDEDVQKRTQKQTEILLQAYEIIKKWMH